MLLLLPLLQQLLLLHALQLCALSCLDLLQLGSQAFNFCLLFLQPDVELLTLLDRHLHLLGGFMSKFGHLLC